MSQQENKKMAEFFYRASAADFKKIPGRAIAYWSSSSVKDVFLKAPEISSVTKIRQGMATTNDDKFLRLWHEVSLREGANKSYGTRAFTGNPLILND